MHNHSLDAVGPREARVSGISEWLEAQSLAGLAQYAKKTPEELRRIIVTEAMTDAAMEYIYSLYDPLITAGLLEEVFRIMAVLQPKVLEGPVMPLLPFQKCCRDLQRLGLEQVRECRAGLIPQKD